MSGVALTLRGVSRNFNGVKAVDGLDLSVQTGSVTALIGPNGSGKTTALNLISGLISADSGSILFGGRVISGKSPHAIAGYGIGRTFQQIRLCPQMSVLDNVLLGFKAESEESLLAALMRSRSFSAAEKKRQRGALELLERFGLAGKAERLGSELSHGQRRLVELARGLAMEPKLLLLDEPMSGVAPTMIRQMQTIVRELKAEGRTILFVEHNVRVVLELSDRVVVLNHGKRIAEGTPDEIRNDAEVIEAYLGKGRHHA